MNANSRDAALRLFFRCFQAFALTLALAIPGVLIYKFTKGASWAVCLSLFAVYLGSFAATIFLMLRFKRQDPVWCTLFGLCFFALLFLSLRL